MKQKSKENVFYDLLDKFKNCEKYLNTTTGEDRLSYYNEITLDKSSIKVRYNDDNEITNISIIAEQKNKLRTLNVSSYNSLYPDFLSFISSLFNNYNRAISI